HRCALERTPPLRNAHAPLPARRAHRGRDAQETRVILHPCASLRGRPAREVAENRVPGLGVLKGDQETMNNERALEYALDYDGCRGRRPLTRTAIRRADRAMRAAFEELAHQSDCSIDDLDLDDWYR